jgi:hypothetical protein
MISVLEDFFSTAASNGDIFPETAKLVAAVPVLIKSRRFIFFFFYLMNLPTASNKITSDMVTSSEELTPAKCGTLFKPPSAAN